MLLVGTHNLEEHLTGLVLCPKPFLLVKFDYGVSEVKITNSQYFVWKRSDKLLMGSIFDYDVAQLVKNESH